jgi:2-polyprenyl-3-methyl-5-hydroxy-6-metoxy-1,4-benzoquinol methylase
VVVLDRDQLPTPREERAEYALHENDPADPDYRRHLAQLTVPLTEGMAPGAEGLDFGCGPGPAISAMLGERGFPVRDYDPIFRPDRAALERRYDFVACTEAAEHFHLPAREFDAFARLLRPRGRLGLMTQLRTARIDFPAWWYVRERSHVTFYSPDTMRWIARRYEWACRIIGDRVVIFARG